MTTAATPTPQRTRNASTKADQGHGESVAEHAKEFAGHTAETVQAVTEKVQEEAAHVAEIAKDGLDRAKDMHASTCEKVKQHPTASILIAAGAGLIIGRILSGR